MVQVSVQNKKREFPPVLVEAEKRIEQWRASVLKDIHPSIDVAIYLLASTTCDVIRYVTNQLMPQKISEVEIITRNNLFGLQFALSGLNGDLPPVQFNENLIVSSLRGDEFRRVAEAVIHMYTYSKARDAFLTYAWGGYEIDDSTENVLRFLNPADWTGNRDRAQQIVGQETKLEQVVDHTRYSGLTLHHQDLVKAVGILPSLSLDNITAAQFASAWMGLVLYFYPLYLKTRQSLVIEKGSIVEKVQEITNLSKSEAERFINLITFDRKGTYALSLFHCPLIPVTQSSLFVVPPAFAFGNPVICIPRLAVHRGRGLNAFTKDMELYFLNKLRNHFKGNGITINTSVPYSGPNDKGDIDLVVYESLNNRLLIAQIKAFIPPDSVEEIIRANQALREGVQQINRVQQLLNNIDVNSWAGILRVPQFSTRPLVQFAVIGNGFAGSDYLPVPRTVVVVDATYLLLSRFKGTSLFDAVGEYQERLSEETTKASEQLNYNTLKLTDITIEVPSWSKSM